MPSPWTTLLREIGPASPYGAVGGGQDGMAERLALRMAPRPGAAAPPPPGARKPDDTRVPARRPA